jgi:hypothetical protein
VYVQDSTLYSNVKLTFSFSAESSFGVQDTSAGFLYPIIGRLDTRNAVGNVLPTGVAEPH